ncbi:sigma-70 family RNA polymerase sigma factor [Pseudonocardiaceae bacterium YIM PH 21723]|nr:sigma-70 family RNA polymerase sigma factor [Pseudonocardiaceae bacterium YIM PH 21723]
MRTAAAAGSPTDSELVSRVVNGDQRAFAELYDRYRRQAYSLARRICVQQDIAEEVVQEAFLYLWREPARFNPDRGSFGTWILMLVHHRSVDAVRKETSVRNRIVAQVEEGIGPDEPGADVKALTAVMGGEVREALQRLPLEQRQALTLAYYGGYTQNEVAALIGVPLGTVKSRMFSGMARLRILLASLLPGDGVIGAKS